MFGRSQDILGVWIGIFGAILALNIPGKKNLYLPVTGVWPLSAGYDCLEQTGLHDGEVWRGRSTALF